MGATQAAGLAALERPALHRRLAAGAHNAFRPLRIHNYRLYFTGQLVSMSGTWMQTAAQAWLVLTLTDSGTALGFVIAAQFLPMLLGGPYGGLLADRFDKRRLMMVTGTGQAIAAGALATLTLAGAIQLWMIYALAMVTGLFAVADNPARQVFIAEMVDRDYLANAVGLNSALFNSARIVGPAIAAVIIAGFGDTDTTGVGICFLVNAASFAAVLMSLALMRTRELRPTPPLPRSKGQVRAGLRYALGEPTLRVVLAVMAVFGLLALNFQVLLPLVAKKVFDGGAGAYGALSTAMGVGSLCGSLVAAGRGRASTRLIAGACLVVGIALTGAALAPTLAVALALWFVVGAATMTLMATSNTTLQLRARPDMRGRVISLYMLLVIGTTPIGGPIVGWVAQRAGTRWAIGLGAAASLCGAAIAVRGGRRGAESVAAETTVGTGIDAGADVRPGPDPANPGATGDAATSQEGHGRAAEAAGSGASPAS